MMCDIYDIELVVIILACVECLAIITIYIVFLLYITQSIYFMLDREYIHTMMR